MKFVCYVEPIFCPWSRICGSSPDLYWFKYRKKSIATWNFFFFFCFFLIDWFKTHKTNIYWSFFSNDKQFKFCKNFEQMKSKLIARLRVDSSMHSHVYGRGNLGKCNILSWNSNSQFCYVTSHPCGFLAEQISARWLVNYLNEYGFIIFGKIVIKYNQNKK